MRTSPPTIAAALFVAAPAFLSGCAGLGADEAPLRAPATAVVVSRHAGTSLTGPLPAAAIVPGASLFVRERAVWVETPVVASETLDAHVRLVLGPGASEPVLSIAHRASGIGLARGDEARRIERALDEGRHGRTVVAWERSGALEPSTTLRLQARADAEPPLALLFDASRTTASAEARVALQVGEREDLERENLVLSDVRRPGVGPLAFVFERAKRTDEPASLVVFLELGETSFGAPTDEDADLETSTAAAAARGRELTRAEEERREIAKVRGEIGDARDRRARLVYLARTCGAPLALDVALIAQDSDLAQLAESVGAAIPADADRAAAAWPIERAAWLLLASKAADGAMAPELSGVLTRQGGEAARSPGAIGDLVAGATGVDDLMRRLVAENNILLEDASPSARLRAYDWLAARGVAPEGFDPFGPLAERRAALRQAAERDEAAKTPGKSP